MKTAVYSQNRKMIRPLPFPNAPTRRQVFHKLLDTVLVAASGAGIGAMLLLWLALI